MRLALSGHQTTGDGHGLESNRRNWKQFKGSAKEKWGKLTDDDLSLIEGRREQLEGRLQERYGKAKDQVRQDVDDWLKSLH